MGLVNLYSSFLLKNPGKIFISGVTSVLFLFGVTLLIRPLPNFKDPLLGFEARDTPIASRMNAWKLLLDESSASANNLSLGPNSINYEGNFHSAYTSRLNNELNFHDLSNRLTEPPLIEMSTQNNKSHIATTDDEDEDEYYRTINSTIDSLPSLMHYSLGSSKAFCGKLYEGYAQVVVAPSTRHSNMGLFNLNSMISICQLDRRLRLEQSKEDSVLFQRDCERFQIENYDDQQASSACCNSWSIPNYIACLNNKTSCMDIDANDMKNTEHLLNLCAPYYLKAPYEECFNNLPKYKDSITESRTSPLELLSSASNGFNSLPRSYCGSIPEKCLLCEGWTFTIMNYLTNENFVQTKLNETTTPITTTANSRFNPTRSHLRANTFTKETIVNKLTYTNIFLPIAKSSSLLKYYQTLSKYSLKTPYTQVKAMDLGLKNSLFDYLISDDTKLFMIALISILIVISIYTWSIILSWVILMIICLSLCLSYALYELIFNIPIFPFMNLLAVVISFGICSDNAMLFCKHWTTKKDNQEENQASANNKNVAEEQLNLNRMLQRAVISTSVATLATALSFIISAISKIIAVRCFCFFATLSVITNYLLVVILLPPALILDSRFSEMANNILTAMDRPEVVWVITKARFCREQLLEIGKMVHNNWIFSLVTKFKFYLIITFITLLSCSSILVFHRPSLQPADGDNIQLLSRKHTFEQYDRNLRNQFAFERSKTGDIGSSVINQFYDPPDTLPVRIVFGIKPIDNGNHLDPHDRGSLTFDSRFDIADPNAQIWLLEFCRKLKMQRFIHPSSAPDLSNCFMNTFKSWMDARSCRDPIQTDLDRSPCCQANDFPYTRHTFNKCVGEAVNIMRKTPQFQPNLHAGVRFFKNTTKVAALIIEYQSNRIYSESYTKMERFFTDIEDWVTWQINNTAPPTLKSGWFISNNLELLALQTELEQSTTGSILLEVLFAMMALMVGTRDLILTMAGTLTIGTIIIVTVAALIVLKWTLGVAESILISLTIGLSIDFALHYTVAYSESRKDNDVTILRILDEVGSPIALATITTSLAGFVIVWSDILAYQELGVFLMLIALISWLTSTFFLLPMLATVGLVMVHGVQYIRLLLRRTLKILIDRL